MLKKRIIISLSFLDGVLFRTKKFIPDYRYTKEFVNLWNIDELILIDLSKKKFNKNFLGLVEYYSNNCFVPISVGGGINSLDCAKKYFSAGADKIIVGYNGLIDKNLNKEIAQIYGNQSIIQSIDFFKEENNYNFYSKSGKEKINYKIDDLFKDNILDYIGEIFLNNIKNDGGLLGFDIEIIKQIESKTKKPIIVLGGGGNWSHFLEVFKKTSASGVCTQNIYHFTEDSISALKKYLISNNITIRETV